MAHEAQDRMISAEQTTEKNMHTRHMEDCIKKWDGRPPNGLVIFAFIQDMCAIWWRRHIQHC